MAYVVNLSPQSEAGAITVIDITRMAVVGAPVTLECGPTSIAAVPSGRWLYITNFCADSVSVFHTGRNMVVGSLCLAGSCPSDDMEVNPVGVAVTGDGGRVVVAKVGAVAPGGAGGGLSLINARANAIAVDDIPTGGKPVAVVASPDGRRAYATTLEGSDILIIDLNQRRVSGRISVGSLRFALALSPDARLLFALDNENRLRVIDTQTNQVIRSVSAGGGADAVAIAPDGSRLYIAHTGSEGLWVMDTATLEVVSKIDLGPGSLIPAPFRLAVAPDGSIACITNRDNNTVAVVDLRAPRLVGRIAVGQTPVSVAIVARAPEISEREPNNELAQANFLDFGGDSVVVAKGAMTPAADVDVFAFEGRAGQQLIADVDAQALGTNIDLRLALLSASGEVIAENDDFDGSKDPYLSVTLPGDGRYFVRVQLARQVTAFQSTYELVLTLR
jgi:YVTN family beta-propeller protein